MLRSTNLLPRELNSSSPMLVKPGGSSGVKSWGERLISAAPWLLGASVIVRLVQSIWHYRTLFVDLHVYVRGGAAVAQVDSLHAAYFVDGWGQHLYFTYPPFAALLFSPLHWVPFPVLALCWVTATVVALFGVVLISQRMLGIGSPRVAMLWTAAAMWFEPVRSCLDLGQVDVFLTLAVLYAAYTSRSWLAGLLVGLAAGVKLTPAITGLHFVGMRRWKAASISAAVFLATIGLSALVLPADTRRYFMQDLHSVKRVGLGGYVCNQSLNGAISRIVGHGVGSSLLVIAAVAAMGVLAAYAWRALGAGTGPRDVLGSLLVVQLFGLMASPISWTHHWVYMVPLVMWFFYGPWHDRYRARIVGWVWTALAVIGVPTLLSGVASQEFSRPWYLAWAGAIYVFMTVATFVWIIVAGRVVRHQPIGANDEQNAQQAALL